MPHKYVMNPNKKKKKAITTCCPLTLIFQHRFFITFFFCFFLGTETKKNNIHISYNNQQLKCTSTVIIMNFDKFFVVSEKFV